MRVICYILIYFLIYTGLFAKPVVDSYQKNFQNSIQKKMRTRLGVPGKNYWQNKSVYDLKCKFDPSTGILEGNGEIIYFNKSKKNIFEIYFHLIQNAYKEDSARARFVPPENSTKGMQIQSIYIDEELFEGELEILGSVGRIKLSKPLRPLNRVVFKIKWNYTLHSAKYENPFDGKFFTESFTISNWYPKIAVYDDLNGWDTTSYDFLHREYSDFSNYYVQVTVPANYYVWGNGKLENSELLGKTIQEKLEKSTEKGIVILKPRNDLGKSENFQTWKWKSENLKDFSFVTSSTMGWKEILIQNERFSILYHKNSLGYQDIPNFLTKLIALHRKNFPIRESKHFVIYDGNSETQFPGFINLKNDSSKVRLQRKLIFQFLKADLFQKIGFNQNKFLWIENGLATAIENLYSFILLGEDFTLNSKMESYSLSQSSILKKKIFIDTLKLGEEEYENISSGKAGIVFNSLYSILGKEKFYKSLTQFFLSWETKHPTGYDFFNSLSKISGQSLDWFWKAGVYGESFPDLKIAKVTNKKNSILLEIQNIGGLPMPIQLKIYYAGDETRIEKPASVWKAKRTFSIELKGQPERIILGEEEIPDSNSKDNYWQP